MNRAYRAPQPQLVDSRDAVWEYLDALLQDIPEESGEPSEETPAGTKIEEPSHVPTVARLPQRQPRPDVPAGEPGSAPPVVTPAAGQVSEVADAEGEAEIPDWGRELFQALFFQVGALRLAVPLTELQSVVPWGDVDVTPTPNRPDWFLGLMRYRERNVRVIDTATMVLPPDKRDTPEAQADPGQILIVGDGTWGLACHSIGDVVKLSPEEVKWRSARTTRRPWLAGTVIGHLCALVDTDAFASMLENRRSMSDFAGR